MDIWPNIILGRGVIYNAPVMEYWQKRKGCHGGGIPSQPFGLVLKLAYCLKGPDFNEEIPEHTS